MLEFFFSRGFSYLNSSEIPIGQQTQIRYRHWGDSDASLSNKETKEDKYEDSADKFHDHESDTLAYTGSFCPQADATYKFKANGRGYLEFYWKDSSGLPGCSKSNSNPCGSKRECTTDSIYLKKGMCYPVVIREESSCIWRDAYLRISVSTDGGNSYSIPTDYIREENVRRCLKWYYGKSCTRCTVDCNGYGYCGGGAITDNKPDKCTCTSYTSDTFCEPPNKVHSTSKGHGFNVITYKSEDSTTVESSKIVTDTASLSFQEAYSKIEVKGNLYMPQSSSYKFRVISKPGATLTINGKTYGSDSHFDCSPNGSTVTVESNSFSGNHNLISFVVKLNTGCSMSTQTIKLQWKFDRWYTDKGLESQWTDIPTKYLFQY